MLVQGGITTATQISAGSGYSCARLSDGTLRCWGSNNYGRLGNNPAVNSSTPVTVAGGITTATQVSAGINHTCARLSDGSLRCWGYNQHGQLGNNSGTNSSTPVTVAGGITTATHISTGIYHTCARLSDGTLRCWGYNGTGQLGNGTTTSSSVPVSVSGITTATQITVGDNHSCARLSDSTSRCWGYNGNGQLGIGVTGSRSIPTSPLALTSTSPSSLQVSINNNSSSYYLSPYECGAIDISLGSLNFPNTLTTNTTIDLNVMPSNATFYSDSSCTIPASSLELRKGLRTIRGYIRSQGLACGDLTESIRVESSDGTLVSPNIDITVSDYCGGSGSG